MRSYSIFFFQAEDGIRDDLVTGVQTCALPISFIGGFTFTAGKFATYEGIEVIEGPADPTITRGFLFWLAEPVTHVGAKLHYTTGPVDVGVGLVNGWDTNNTLFETGDNNNQKTLIWRAAVTPSPMFFAAFSGI